MLLVRFKCWVPIDSFGCWSSCLRFRSRLNQRCFLFYWVSHCRRIQCLICPLYAPQSNVLFLSQKMRLAPSLSWEPLLWASLSRFWIYSQSDRYLQFFCIHEDPSRTSSLLVLFLLYSSLTSYQVLLFLAAWTPLTLQTSFPFPSALSGITWAGSPSYSAR